MTKFMNKKFSVGGYTKAYADNYDAVFRLKDETRFCLRCHRTYRIPREPEVPFGTPCPDCLEAEKQQAETDRRILARAAHLLGGRS